MNKLIVFAFVLALVGCATIGGDTGKDVKYIVGIVSSTDCEKVDRSDSYPTKRIECGGIAVTSEASHVHISIGQSFGVEYFINNLNDKNCYTITHQLKHPMMIDPRGEERTRYARSMDVGQCYDGETHYRDVFSWHIGEKWESVKGPWFFTILLDGEPLISEKIYAY